ncbi:GNAT family N-acetyltransferase [Pseudorhodobacter aquimaris]|uniref:GNAT family N-acetyltransferase n=1 Tax=Pseudorhodobacter aquimaris TaxID=687412 RepID=UPI00067AA144|nr:GNAT family N-acetyltransferase [Pseudorhodobacter aquimaris]
MTVAIRDITPEDEPLWRDLWDQYLTFYAVQLAPEVTDKTWARLIDPQAVLRGRVAVLDGVVVGFALYHHHLSTWAANPDCYLEDLFLTEAARGHGLGRGLIDDLIKICHESGYSRLYWHTDEGNTRARKLYDSYTPYDGHLRYRIKL